MPCDRQQRFRVTTRDVVSPPEMPCHRQRCRVIVRDAVPPPCSSQLPFSGRGMLCYWRCRGTVIWRREGASPGGNVRDGRGRLSTHVRCRPTKSVAALGREHDRSGPPRQTTAALNKWNLELDKHQQRSRHAGTCPHPECAAPQFAAGVTGWERCVVVTFRF